jgi:hypothetical protein
MLTRKQFEDLWAEIVKASPKCSIPNYDEYTECENMFEDYLDIFRGKNTRIERSISNTEWYYEHPFFDGDKPKLKNTPCVKFVMIGEARPNPNSPKMNKCGGDEKNTYFYNVTHVGTTKWLSETCKAFSLIYTKPTCPNQKADLLLEVASKGYILIDLFPFAISFDSRLRGLLNKTRVSDLFFKTYLNEKLDELCKYKCEDNKLKPIIAFSGPAKIHHYLIHQITIGSLLLNPCFITFDVPNYFVATPLAPKIMPLTTVKWSPTANLLNGKYMNPGLKRVSFYRAGCWDASFYPNHLLFRNAFNI